MSEGTWLEGRISVEASIRGGNRPIEMVYLRTGKWDRSFQRLKTLAEETGISISQVGDDFFDTHAVGQSHGGVMARVGPRRFASLQSLVQNDDRPFVVMLDGIEDPFNFGQAVRALYAAGIAGLVVRPRNWLSASAIVTRASAGATELMPTAVAGTAVEAADLFRDSGLKVACTAQESAVSIFQADLTIPIFLLIGGEKRGITRSFIAQADLRINIPYGRSFEHSLGAAASTAVVAFEVLRQRSRP